MNNNEELNQAPDIVVVDESDEGTNTMSWVLNLPLPVGTRLYTAPPKREWVDLTEEQIFEIWFKSPPETEDRFAFVKAVITELKEKNT